MPLFINFQTLLWLAYLFNVDSTFELISVESSVKFTDDSRRTGKDCHVTMPSSRQGGVAVEVVFVCHLNGLFGDKNGVTWIPTE